MLRLRPAAGRKILFVAVILSFPENQDKLSKDFAKRKHFDKLSVAMDRVVSIGKKIATESWTDCRHNSSYLEIPHSSE